MPRAEIFRPPKLGCPFRSSNEINLRRAGNTGAGGQHFRHGGAALRLGPAEFFQASPETRGVAANLKIPKFEFVIRRNQFQQLAG